MQALPPTAADDIAGVLFGLILAAFCLAVRCVIAGVRADLDTDQAVTAVCKPCNGETGRCTCPRKCAHPRCAARDTVISDKQFAAELAELLRKEEHRE